jgi:hypothetical protein
MNGNPPSPTEQPMMRVGNKSGPVRRLGGALALVMRGAAREVVLVDRTRERARAVATDLRSGTPMSQLVDIRNKGRGCHQPQ